MPLWLFLGGDAVHDTLARAEQWRAVAEEWRAVGEGLSEDDVQSQHMRVSWLGVVVNPGVSLVR